MRARNAVVLAAIVAAFATPFAAHAKDPAPSAKPTPSASAAPSTTASAALPPGHPALPNGDDDDMDGHAHGADPHGGMGGVPGMFKPPPDTSREDPSLPPGSIAVELRDPDDQPIANQPVTLGIMQQSVAKGDSRSHKAQTTDDHGQTTFAQLTSGSGIAYRVSAVKDGATFAAMPFQMAQNRAMRVVLHMYPVTNDVKQALVISQGVMGLELKDDRVQIEQLFDISVLGRYAWMPKDVILTLPEGFTALNAQQSMSDQGIDAIDKKGAKLKGTFAPGRHRVLFRWQLPWSGDKDIRADIGMPPHVATMRVVAAAGQGMRLEVEGFPAAVSERDEQGQSLLATERQASPQDAPLTELRVALLDLPTQGPARWIATGCAAFAVAFGIILATQSKKSRRDGKGDAKAVRAALLADLEELERAHRAGDVGPKTYDRARREIIDALARTLAPTPGDAPSAKERIA